MILADFPLPLQVFPNRGAVELPEGGVFVHREGSEDRSRRDETWPQERWCSLAILEDGPHDFHFTTNDGKEWPLRSERRLAEFWANHGDGPICIDITGISTHIWPSLVRSALSTGRIVNALYVEPASYNFRGDPDDWALYDLSERRIGVESLPGFGGLRTVSSDRLTFVALLGFEGARIAHVLERDEIQRGKAISIVGAPGFRPEYPIHTVLSNRIVLQDEDRWQYVRYVRANCPFSLYRELDLIAAAAPEDILRIAIMGTRPHALGAVLFAVLAGRGVELIHDYPIPHENRTSGHSRTLVYHLSEFATQLSAESALAGRAQI